MIRGLLLASWLLCSTLGSMLYSQSFSEEERRKILHGDTASMMRVIQVTNSEENKLLNAVSGTIDPHDPLVKVLMRRMYLSMRDPSNPGIGIAAPQVGINRRICWVQRYDKADQPFECYINPKIVWASELMRKGREGCLSIPDINGEVIRHFTIELIYQDLGGATHREIVEGFTAVIFQHEIDHLDGVLFTERLEEQKGASYQDPSSKVIFLTKELPFR